MTPRHLLLIAAGVLVAVAPAAAQRSVRLRTFESKAGGFRVKLPDEPRTETKELALGNGGQTVSVTTERADDRNGVVYAVTYADYPESYRQVPAKTVLDGVRDGLKGTDGKPERDDEVFLGPDKIPGREFRIVAGRRVVHARVFLIGTRLYQVMATGSKDRMPSETVREFHDSFELVK